MAKKQEIGMTDEEAYGSIAGEMYVEGEEGYETPEQVLSFMEPAVVEAAERFAREHRRIWPPRASGMIMTISSYRFD